MKANVLLTSGSVNMGFCSCSQSFYNRQSVRRFHTQKMCNPLSLKCPLRNVTYGCHNIFFTHHFLFRFFFFFNNFFSTCGTAKYIFFSHHSYKSYMCNRENIRPESGVVVLFFVCLFFFRCLSFVFV